MDERLANVLTGDIRVHLDKAVKELEFVGDILSSKKAHSPGGDASVGWRTIAEMFIVCADFRNSGKATTVTGHDRFCALSLLYSIGIERLSYKAHINSATPSH